MFFSLALPGLVAAQTLVGHWSFDGTATDSSGFGNDGTIFGAASYTTGRVGMALNLSGPGNYVTIPNSASLQTANLTIAYWAYLNFHQNPVIANKRNVDDSQSAWQVSITSFDLASQNLQFCLWQPGTCQYSPVIVPDPVGRWTHVAVTYDGSNQKWYVDGLLVLDSAIGTFHPEFGTADITLGNYINGGYDYDGLLDEVRIYDGALSAAQIAVLVARDRCKNGGWQSLSRNNSTPFKNQGDCIQYVNTGK